MTLGGVESKDMNMEIEGVEGNEDFPMLEWLG